MVDAHGVRTLDLGRRSPARRIAVVRRRADADDRNVEAVVGKLSFAYEGARV